MTRIRVLLATCDGEAYLAEQLASLAAQNVAGSIDVIASDDGSRDHTLDILRHHQEQWQRGTFAIHAGPARGFAENFRALIGTPAADADYVAFCDQDDVWMPDKLAVAIAALERDVGPALYCSRTLLVDARLQPLGKSPDFRRPPHFRNALVQSLAGGNTMVLNRAALALVAESARRTPFVSHDWWCYLMVSGAGGRVVFDRTPRIAYRQHGRNLVGHNMSPRARWVRLVRSLQGQFMRWNDANIAGLSACRDLLSPQARETLDTFVAARKAAPLRSLYLVWKSGIYRQLPGGNISLAMATILRKL